MILGIIAIWINIVFVFALKTFLDFLSVASHILPSLASFYPGFIKCTFSPPHPICHGSHFPCTPEEYFSFFFSAKYDIILSFSKYMT